MGFIFGLFSLILFVVVLIGGFFLLIFLARKIGLIKNIEVDDDGVPLEKSYKPLLGNYSGDLKKITQSLLFRFFIIAALTLLMMLPLDMVSDVVRDRNQSYHKVLSDISSTWGHQQNIKGPSLFIPYTEKFISEELKTDKDGNERKVNKTIYKQRTAIILPNDLKINANLKKESLKRSIHEALLFTADVNIEGDFKYPEVAKLSNDIDKIHWDRAWLSLGVSDTQAINKVSQLKWGINTHVDFEPGTRVVNTIARGFHAPLDLSALTPEFQAISNTKKRIPFSLQLNINGSKGFYFSPFGKTTDVKVTSDWPHPSFQGNVLPLKREVNNEGFNATWSVPHLARNYPQIWTLEKQQYNLDEFNAGVNLFDSVSLYSKITRAIKYGLLFFSLTYITFLLFEMGISRRLHIVQYGVIGLALSIFYLVLLSLAEHSGFLKAYITAASIIIIMISSYAYASIRSLRRMFIVVALLTGLYSLLYLLLKLEDYALLAGTGLLLCILAVMMYLTRNIGKSDSNERELID